MIEVTVDTAALSKLIDDLGEGFDDEVVEAMAQEILDGADQLVPVDTGALKKSGHVEERRGGASGEPGGRRIMPGPDWPGWRPEQRPLIGPPKLKRPNERVLAPYTRTRARKGIPTG